MFRADRPGALEPVAWVTAIENERALVWIRFAPGESNDGAWRLAAIDAPTDLGAALELAVPPEVAGELGRRLSARVSRLFTEIVKESKRLQNCSPRGIRKTKTPTIKGTPATHSRETSPNTRRRR